MSSTLRERREAVVLEHVAAENRHDVDAALATFHRARYEVNGEPIDGDAAVRGMLGELMAAFPDFHVEPRKVHHADDAVIGESRMTGTHDGTFAGLPPSGRRIDVAVVGIFEFDDDRLVCEKVFYDLATVLRQVGALVDPAVA